MKNIVKTLTEKLDQLKTARLEILRIHKLLIDIEREKFERQKGSITSGQFLGLLIDSSDFQWLRKFSTRVVEIDEMLDLDDGFTEEMVEDQLIKIKNLTDLNGQDTDFEKKYGDSLREYPQVAAKHEELKQLLIENANTISVFGNHNLLISFDFRNKPVIYHALITNLFFRNHK